MKSKQKGRKQVHLIFSPADVDNRFLRNLG
jgi:hypothetical protein